MSRGSFTDFENALRAFESGIDEARYRNGQISDQQIKTWIGQTNYDDLMAGRLSWRDAQYLSMNSLGFVGYQLGEALMIDLGYYRDDFYYGNGAATNTWDGTFTGKGGVTSLAALKTTLQEGVMLDAFGYNLAIIENGLSAQGKNLQDLIGTTRNYTSNGQTVSVELTYTGILAAAHLRGAYGTLDLLLNDRPSSDENGTSILQYISQFGGYDMTDLAALRSAVAGGTTQALSETIWNSDFNGDGQVGTASQFTEGADTVTGGASADIFSALGGNDIVHGGGGGDRIDGGAGDDTLYGDAGSDILIGGIGIDLLYGGADNDTYNVDNVGDRVFENAGEGTDAVFASVSYALAANVENLTLTGSARINGTGNALDNVITGNTNVNFLTGGAGNDTLDGGGGADRLIGGLGNDTYIINTAGSTVIEQASEGIDTVRAVGNYTLSANVENLVLTGASGNGFGNAVANTLTGNNGNNVLDGRGGADTLIGGLGNDTYVIDNAGDVIVELSGQGNDTVRALISYTMAANTERLELASASNISGTGNAGANTIVGSTGANTLTGLGGKDTLTGGAGRDTFVFTSLSDSTVTTTGRDTITDFSRSDGERIDLRLIDAVAGTTANDAFSFIGTNAFSGIAGQLRYQASGSDTLVSADVDGNSVADLAILLTGEIALTSGNFLL